jgi:hypothetical protein
MTPVETGTRALTGAVSEPIAGEADHARQLLHLLTGHAGAGRPRLWRRRVPGRGRPPPAPGPRSGRPVIASLIAFA